MPHFTTSGTTGTPKRFHLSDTQIGLRARMTDANRGTGFETVKNLFVDFHPNSMVGANYAKYQELHPDMTVHFASDKFGSIATTVAFFDTAKIDGILSSPKGLLNYAEAVKDGHRMAWIGSVTGRLSAATSRAIRAGLGDNLWSWYAAGEAGVIALADAKTIEQVPNCVGKVIAGVTVAFDEGEIIVKSDMLIDGYADDPTTTEQRFKNGWYHTRDLGHMQDGLLILSGRKST